MKKVLSLLASAAICGASYAQGVDGISVNGKLQIIGNQLSNEKRQPVQLRGWSTFSTQYPEGTDCLKDEGSFQVMKGWGANVCRIAMYVDETPDGGGYIQRPDYHLENVKDYIQSTIKNDMYAVIDWHILETSNNTKQPAGDPNTYINDAKTFFDKISKWVAQRQLGGKVLYELCNEPTVNFGRIKDYAEPVMDVVLANDPDALFIVGTESWCQKILDATNNPLKAKYRDKALYSFHYYACSHEYLLGNFSSACAKAPCIVSEWSTVSFSGDGASCMPQSDKLMGYCNGANMGKQLVSWFFWSWGRKNEGSAIFYGKQCENPTALESNLSAVGRQSVLWVSGKAEIPDVPVAKSKKPIKIPSTLKEPFDWCRFDEGGEGVAYHDGNGDAYDKDLKAGFYKAYNNTGAEVDALSVGRDYETGQNQTLGLNPDFTYDNDGNILSYSGNKLCWKYDWGTNSCLHDSLQRWPTLNSGVSYGMDWTFNTDHMYEGVDISKCSAEYERKSGEDWKKPGYTDHAHSSAFHGTDAEGNECDGTHEIQPYGHGNLANTEPDEWISYTVDVETPGYYRVDYLAQGSTDAAGEMTFTLVGENGGNILRDLKDKANIEAVQACRFSGDGLVEDDYDHWQWRGIIDDNERSEIGIVFRKAGVQQIIVSTKASTGNVGPLFFILVDKDVTPEIENNTKSVKTEVSDFTIYPNPTSGEFTVKLAGEETGLVQVYNVAGQVVYSEAISEQSELTVSKKLASGIYTVVVSTENGSKTQKLSVK